MAIAFRAAGALASQFQGTPTIPYPAGVAANDLLLIHYVAGTATVTPTTPSGWTLLLGPVAMSGGGNANRGYVYYRVAGGSEPSSVTFANSGASNTTGGIMTAWTGCDITTPIDGSATATLPTSGTTGTAPSVTTTKASTRVLHLYWDWTGSTTVTPNGADTERYDTFLSATNIVFELADTAQGAAGATGTSSVTFAAATSGGLAATIALAPLTVSLPTVADFTGTPVTGAAPLTVAFTDASSNTPTSWLWDFGDGTTSTSQNPSHTYTTSGVYTVSLTASNTGGSNTKTRSAYVTSIARTAPSGPFTPSPLPDGDTSFADQLVRRFEPWLTIELEQYLRAVASMFEEVELYAFDVENDDEFYEGWTILFDPARCPAAALPYLAQFVGERLPDDATEADRRERIADRPTQRRGTPESVFQAAQRHLTGGRLVSMFERYTGVIDLVAIRTNARETPDPAQTQRDVLSMLPADVVLDYLAVTGRTWDDTKGGTWTTVKAKTWSDTISGLTGWATFQGP
jgi:PKD repeat protein